ncbi:MAG: succinate dehydrogenase, cytochrome b556 subunit [Hyphomicrobium sp.]|nr:MAG: succinate dehydrogenase, cytochrome b556 subunit [Hyphomicrobium sp.]
MGDAKSVRGGAKMARPLSPHLQIYSPLINMVMSILHRITGAALYFGSVLLAWWLIAAASGPQYFGYVMYLFGSVPGKLVLVGFTWALIHHAAGGLRHFLWDTGRGYDLKSIDLLSWGTIAVSILLTALVWSVVMWLK